MMRLSDIKKLILILPLAVMFATATSGQAWGEETTEATDPATAEFKVEYGYDNVWTDKKIKSYYNENDLKAEEIDSEISAILDSHEGDVGFLGDGKMKLIRLNNSLETLLSYTGKDGFDKFAQKREVGITGGAMAYRQLDKINDFVNELTAIGVFSADEAFALRTYAKKKYDLGAERASLAVSTKTDNNTNADLINSLKTDAAELMQNDCPTTDLIRAKYTAGCWSCLVVEKLSSAFMTAASKAYSLSQKAGLILLGLGSVLWILLWGLRNVSSLTQLEPGNILNELIKFGFKVALAYIFITLGLKVVGTYFINPIMGVGAKIAESYWDKEKIKPYTEDYVWDDIDEEAVSKEEKAAIAAQQAASTPEPQTQMIDYSPEQQALIEAQRDVDSKAEPQQIPTFLVPGTNTGHISSPVGCRKRPIVQCINGKKQFKVNDVCYGSASHMGLDIGTSGKAGGVVFAMAGGKITYYGGQGSTAGYAATIQTKDKKGNIWSQRYMHMQPRSHTDFKFPNNEVATGQQIGFIGKTGATKQEHLHIEIRFTGTWEGKQYNDVPLDPLRLVNGTFYPLYASQCTGNNLATFPEGFKAGQVVPANAWSTTGKAVFDLSATYIKGNQSGSLAADYSSLVMNVPAVTYSGPTDIMSKAVMNSILGATKAIGDITSENMVLGDAVMCYASLDNGGAWHPFDLGAFTNFWMWVEGMFIWCTGLLLTVAVAYYLLDLSFKIGFAVVALPLVVGLWPFEITRDKITICISIIAKSAATFAFLAITTTFTVQLTDAVYSYEDEPTAAQTTAQAPDEPRGLAKLYAIYDRASMAETGAAEISEAQQNEDMEYASSKLAIFSTTFVLLLFAFLYSFKLVQATVPDLVNKFFPDKAFGNQQPMHHWATAASKWAKDQAMKPVGFARDAAMYQGGKAIKNGVGKAVGGAVSLARKAVGKGPKKDGDAKVKNTGK